MAGVTHTRQHVIHPRLHGFPGFHRSLRYHTECPHSISGTLSSQHRQTFRASRDDMLTDAKRGCRNVKCQNKHFPSRATETKVLDTPTSGSDLTSCGQGCAPKKLLVETLTCPTSAMPLLTVHLNQNATCIISTIYLAHAHVHGIIAPCRRRLWNPLQEKGCF